MKDDASSALRVQISTGGELPYHDQTSGGVLSTFSDNVFGSWFHTTENGGYSSFFLDFQFSQDNRALKLTIKPDVKFHNGRPMTSTDFEFSLLRGFHIHPPFFAGFLKCIEGLSETTKNPKPGSIPGIRVLDDKNVEIHFTRPCREILHSLTLPFFSPRPHEELLNDLTRFKELPVGAGPYRVMDQDIENGIYILDRVHGRGPRKVHLVTKTTSAPPDLILGNIPTPLEFVRATNENPMSTLTLFTSNSHSLFNDSEIRKLFYLIFDRPLLATDLVYTATANLTTFGKADLPTSAEIEAARARLKRRIERDFPECLRIEIPVIANSFGSAFQSVLDQLKMQFECVGINANFFPRPDKYLEGEEAKKYPFWMWWLVIDPLAPSAMLASFHPQSAYQFHRVRDPKVEQLFLDVQGSLDENHRREAEQRLDHIISSNGYGVPLLHSRIVFSYDPRSVKSLGKQTNFLSIDLSQVTFVCSLGKPDGIR